MNATDGLLPLPTPLCVNFAAAATALAPSLTQSAFLARRGSFAARESALLDPNGETVTACTLPLLDPYLIGPARLFALTDLALHELAAELGESFQTLRVKLYVLLDAEYSGQLPNGSRRGDVVAGELRQQVKRTLKVDCQAEAIARDSVGLGETLPRIAAELRQNVSDVALIVAVHTDHDPTRVSELFNTHRLRSDETTDGLLPGEASVVLALTTQTTTRNRNLPRRAVLHSATWAYDKARPDNDESAFDAIGMTLAFRNAVQHAPLHGDRIGWLMSDVSFEAFRLHEYQAILSRGQDHLGMPQVHEFPAQRFGALGAATMPLHVALAAAAWRYGYSPAPWCLSMAGSDDGARCCLIASG